MGEPKRYGLILSNKKFASTPLKKLAVFGDDSSDDEDSAHKEVNLSLIQEAHKKKQMKQTQIEIQKALQEDPSVYEYDAVYDEMEGKKKAANVKVTEKDRKPKYIEGLLKSAAARKREYERTVERQVQKERETEQGEFDDKEAFVTEAFRKKMQEQAEEEERLKRQEAIDAANDVTKQKDLSLFYRNLLNRNVSLGGSFTADNAAKIDLQDKNDNSKSRPKDEEATQGASDDGAKKIEKHRYKDDIRNSRSEEDANENRRHPRSPKHSGHHNYDSRKRRDNENDKDRRKQSSHSPEKERRRHKEKDRDDNEHRRRSSHSERHRSSYDDHRHSDRSETTHDERRERDRKRDRGKRDREDKDSMEKKEKESNRVVKETKESKGKLNEETVAKFGKRSTDETVMSAKERYLARKRARDAEKATLRNDDSDEE